MAGEGGLVRSPCYKVEERRQEKTFRQEVFLRRIVIFIHIGLKNKLAAQENAAQPKEGLNTGVCPSSWKSCTPTADGKMSRKHSLPSFLFGVCAHNPVFWVRPNIAGHSNSP